MMNNGEYLQRLGEVDLERAASLEEMDKLKVRIAALDNEYVALKNLLTAPSFDKRWASNGTSLPETMYYILSGARKPLHYKDIHRILLNSNFHISGNAALSNLVVRLNRDKRFIKVKPGIYGLAEWESKKILPSITENNLVSTFDGDNKALSLAEERDRERIKFILESIDVDIKVTQNNLQALRNKLLGKESEFKLPENIDPVVAAPALKRKLVSLLEQKDKLNQKLLLLETRFKGAQTMDKTASTKY